jgi:hypothetical protein
MGRWQSNYLLIKCAGTKQTVKSCTALAHPLSQCESFPEGVSLYWYKYSINYERAFNNSSQRVRGLFEQSGVALQDYLYTAKEMQIKCCYVRW